MITGAAGGIGRGTALCLAKEGCAVVTADLNSPGGESVIAEIAAEGGRAVFQHPRSSCETLPWLSASRSMIVSTSHSDRDSRSSFHTTSTSPLRS